MRIEAVLGAMIKTIPNRSIGGFIISTSCRGGFRGGGQGALAPAPGETYPTQRTLFGACFPNLGAKWGQGR